jgi:hypothetical protein
VQTLLTFYRAGRKDGDFDLGIERGLRRLLSAPAFLFRVEREPLRFARGKSLSSGATYRMSDLDLASRLSFFLWSSIPDDELLDAAIGGTLTTGGARTAVADARRALAGATTNFTSSGCNLTLRRRADVDEF